VVRVWADAVTGLSEKTIHREEIVFGVLMEIDVDRQSEFVLPHAMSAASWSVRDICPIGWTSEP
jgi:hypothetical protein